MKPTKILLLLLLAWLVPASLVTLFDLIILFPFMTYTPSEDLANHRLLSVRSAVFMTLAYYIVNHLRKKKPLSSVSPILVFINFLILFSIILIIKNNGPNLEWLVVICASVFSGVLFIESKNERNKIFKDAW